jgi:hypothetical protein
VHYSIPEISQMWGISQDLARDLFRNEESVLIITRPAISRRKQRYTSMRVPESVLRRVYLKLTTRRPTPLPIAFRADSARRP